MQIWGCVNVGYLDLQLFYNKLGGLSLSAAMNRFYIDFNINWRFTVCRGGLNTSLRCRMGFLCSFIVLVLWNFVLGQHKLKDIVGLTKITWQDIRWGLIHVNWRAIYMCVNWGALYRLIARVDICLGTRYGLGSFIMSLGSINGLGWVCICLEDHP